MNLLTILFTLSLSFQVLANSEVVAEVNGVKITKDEFEKEFKEKMLYPSHKKITKEGILMDMVNRQLGIQEALKEKLDKDPFVKARMDDILHNAVISKNLTDELGKIKVSDSDVKKFYSDNPEYRTSQILYRLKAFPTKEEVEKGLAVTAEIYNILKKDPSKFEELARKHSQIATHQNGGDIGYVPSTSLAPEYYEAIKGKDVGYITKPVRSQFGYHIIKVTGVKQFQDVDKQLYKRIIFDIKRDKVIEDYYASLKKGSKVTINKDKL